MTYWLSKYFAYLVFKLFYRLKVAGSDNIPSAGGYILAANHNSLIDPPLVAASVKSPLHFMAKKSLFDIPLFGAFIRSANAFPVRRGMTDKKAIKKSIEILNSGGGLLIFPEGGRRESGKALKGIAYLAHKTSSPVVPAALVNNCQLHRLRRIYVNIGRPLKFPRTPHEKPPRQQYLKFADSILQKIYQGSEPVV